MIVAIDGPAGAGKSTVARALAERLGFRYLDTGAMYRALTWLGMQRGLDLSDAPALAQLAREHPVLFLEDDRVWIAGTDVTPCIRETRIDRMVPVVARHPAVREVMRDRQRELGHEGNVVMEGRDIGTVVAPETPHKFYLNASPEVRARRRQKDLEKLEFKQSVDQVAKSIVERDRKDSSRVHSPLKMADDAKLIDTSDQTVEQTASEIVADLRARGVAGGT